MSAVPQIPLPPGMVAPGNINLNGRPVVHNDDGTISTEYSVSFDLPGGREVLVPTVVNGKFLTPDGKKPPEGSPEEKQMFHRAFQHYQQTGQHMGIFDNAADADTYAEHAHSRKLMASGNQYVATTPQQTPSQTIPMFAPDGSLGDIPITQANAARAAGAKPAVNILDPQGNHGYVPADRVQDAVKAGGKVLPFEQQEMQHPGLWQDVVSNLKGLVTGLGQQMPSISGSPLHPPTQEQLEGSEQQAQQFAQEDRARQDAGYGMGYRLAAGAATAGMAPVNPTAQEQAAREGDVNAVAGNAIVGAGVAAAPLIAEGAIKAPGVARDIQAHLVPGLQLAEDVSEAPRYKIASRNITKLIKPMAGDLKYGAEPAAALPLEGITGNTLEDLGEKTYARARDVGQTIDAVAQAPENASKVVDISQAVNGPIDDAIRNAVRTGDKPLYDKLQTLRKQVLNTWQEVEDEAGGKSLEPAAPRQLHMSPMDAIKLKRDIADMTRWTGDPMDNEVNAVKARMFGGIKDAVNKAVPDLVELNKRYADLVNAGKAIERRAPVAARSNDFSLGDLGTMIAGQALTGSSGVGIAAEVARRAAHHPGVMSRVANAIMPESLKYEEPAAIRARLSGGTPPPQSSSSAPSRSGTPGGAARENGILQQVKTEHPDWSVSQQLQEAAKRSEKGSPEGGKGPRSDRRQNGESGPRGHVFTEEERKQLDANHARALAETKAKLGPITREEIVTGKPASRRAQDILSGKAGD